MSCGIRARVVVVVVVEKACVEMGKMKSREKRVEEGGGNLVFK
jgi:hypothetical protein